MTDWRFISQVRWSDNEAVQVEALCIDALHKLDASRAIESRATVDGRTDNGALIIVMAEPVDDQADALFATVIRPAEGHVAHATRLVERASP